MSGALKVVAPGLHDTVQDLGRFGHQALGVPVSGALDAFSLRLANRLVGNPEGASALEILYQGPTLEVMAEGVLLGLAGGDAEIELLGERRRPLGGWRSLVLRRGEVFRIGRLSTAACCYLAVAGGIAAPPCLGSASTFVRGGFGGLGGRALRAGDLVPLAEDPLGEGAGLVLPAPPEPMGEQAIRIVLGPQDDHFAEAAVAALTGETYTVSKDADRMGMRLDGPRLAHRDGYNIVSDGIATGAIQVPGSGQPILLLADHQTTGGYPKIATVISADLPVVGRRRPGDAIRFTVVSALEGERLRREQEAALAAIAEAMVPAPPLDAFDLDQLYRANLISGVVAGNE
jgi:biotin-dependent carboxylase-like uncharacterized protein